MAAGTSFISVPGSGGVPEDYLVSGAAAIDLISVSATFDGSGAGSSFRPAVQIIDAADRVVATMVGDTVAAGDSAEVTFAPFLTRSGGGGSGTGIQFDVDNEGQFLRVGTNGPAMFGGFGFYFQDLGGGGIKVESSAGGPISIQNDGGGGIQIHDDDDDLLELRASGDGGINIRNDGDGLLNLETTGNGGLTVLNDGNGVLLVQSTSGDIQIDATGGAFLTLTNLPTVNPGGTNRVWNNGGVLNIT